MSFAVLFPGQGSQFVGMGADLFDARADLLGDRAEDVLGWSLRRLCLEGPEEELTRTERAQPALFAVAYAMWEELRAGLPGVPKAGAGHSLGEYTALAAAGMLDFDDALSLVMTRGKAMAAAADQEPSGMAALLGADLDKAEELAGRRRGEGGRLYVANINAPGQVVVAGGSEDLAWLEANAADLGVRRVVSLNVAGAFHSPFMVPAAEAVRKAVDLVSFHAGSFPVWANVTAAPIANGEVADLLARQVVTPVRFADTLVGMASAGINTFVHIGPGDVTAGMAKRSAPGTRALVVNELAAIPAAIAELGTMP
jgi:[acyl-carrier-protein] S-malonyltransferase